MDGADNTKQIMALLAKRLHEAEQQVLNSPEFLALKARNYHMLMEHGSGELCNCPEWN